MSFDIEPDGDPHGECAIEIRRLKKENERLKRVLARELSEDDELGSEFAFVVALKEENARFREALDYVAWPGIDRDHWDRVHKAQEALRQCFCKNGIRGRYCFDYHCEPKGNRN